jgi:SOS-response transcriptional repressor LexA
VSEGFDINAVRDALGRLMRGRDIKRKPLAREAGLGETAIRDIFDPRRNDVRTSTLIKLAEFFDVSLDHLTGREPVPLLGRIGAGGAVMFEASDDPETVPRPPIAAGRLMALEVVGDSMLPKYEAGDVIYVRRDHEGVLPEYLGEYCAVHTTDGGTFLKILGPGTEPGRYTLRSLNAADMTNVEIVWATPVLWVMPRRARQLSR